MKKYVVSSMGSNDIITIDITDKLKLQLQTVVEIRNKMVTREVFDEELLFKIPLTYDVETYRWSTTFQRSYDRDEDVLAFKTIECFALDDDEMRAHVEKYKLNLSRVFLTKSNSSNLTKNGQGGYIITNGEILNIGSHKYDFGESILSDCLDIVTILDLYE